MKETQSELFYKQIFSKAMETIQMLTCKIENLNSVQNNFEKHFCLVEKKITDLSFVLNQFKLQMRTNEGQFFKRIELLNQEMQLLNFRYKQNNLSFFSQNILTNCLTKEEASASKSNTVQASEIKNNTQNYHQSNCLIKQNQKSSKQNAKLGIDKNKINQEQKYQAIKNNWTQIIDQKILDKKIIQIKNTLFENLEIKLNKLFKEAQKRNIQEDKSISMIQNQNNIISNLQKKVKTLQSHINSLIITNNKAMKTPSNTKAIKNQQSFYSVQDLGIKFQFLQTHVQTKANRQQTKKAILFLQQKINKLTSQFLVICQDSTKFSSKPLTMSKHQKSKQKSSLQKRSLEMLFRSAHSRTHYRPTSRLLS